MKKIFISILILLLLTCNIVHASDCGLDITFSDNLSITDENNVPNASNTLMATVTTQPVIISYNQRLRSNVNSWKVTAYLSDFTPDMVTIQKSDIGLSFDFGGGSQTVPSAMISFTGMTLNHVGTDIASATEIVSGNAKTAGAPSTPTQDNSYITLTTKFSIPADPYYGAGSLGANLTYVIAKV